MHLVQEWFEEHDKDKVLTWPPNFPDLNLIEHLQDVSDQQTWSLGALPCRIHDLQQMS